MGFFKAFFASLLAIVVAIGLFIFFIIGLVASQSSEPEPYLRDGSVLTINIFGGIPERSSASPFDELTNPGKTPLSLELVRKNLTKAAKDDRISGIKLRLNYVVAPWAYLEEMRSHLLAFKASGKFIYAYTDDAGMNEQAYFLATVADTMIAPPETFFEFDGFYAETQFFKRLFDKVGIEPEISRFGKYKSAVEPYLRTGFSAESKEQILEILDTSTSMFVQAVAHKTGHSIETIQTHLNSAPSLDIKTAYERKMIDILAYPHHVDGFLNKRMGRDSSATIREVTLARYDKVTKVSTPWNDDTSTDKIGVLYASGMIIPSMPEGFNVDESAFITDEEFNAELDKLHEDKNVKAIVLRINSPGGAGTTSDNMWKRIREVAQDKPVIASMGAVAASGGYYMAMGADVIFADSTTVTGSIGVFGTKFNLREMMEENIGITFDVVETHQYADWLRGTKGFNSVEEKAFQKISDDFYETFITKAAASRNMTKEEIHEVAQGRVWTGLDAQEVGLIDEIGSLNDAIEMAAEMAEIQSYGVVSYPSPKTFVEKLLAGSNQTMVSVLLPKEAQTLLHYFDAFNATTPTVPYQIHTLFPYEIVVR